MGRPGAGKSTTISILTGLVPPTAGEAVVRGVSIRGGGMARIRRRLGVCAQDDRLFPEISVREHCRIYCMFKGLDAAQAGPAVCVHFVEGAVSVGTPAPLRRFEAPSV